MRGASSQKGLDRSGNQSGLGRDFLAWVGRNGVFAKSEDVMTIFFTDDSFDADTNRVLALLMVLARRCRSAGLGTAKGGVRRGE